MRAALLVGVVAVGPSGCGRDGVPQAGGEAPGGGGAKAVSRTAFAPQAVEVVPVGRGDVLEVVRATGTVEASRVVKVVSRTEGRVVALAVRTGDRVSRDGLLARLDSAEVEASLRLVEARLAKAEADEARGRALVEEGILARSGYDALLTALEVERANRDLLRTQLDFTELRAPLDATVTARLVEQGDYLPRNTHAFTLSTLDDLQVTVEVSELALLRLARGAQALVELDALPDRTLEGRVRRVFPTVSPSSRLGLVEIALPDPTGRVRPGLLARTRIIAARRQNVLFLPADALPHRGRLDAGRTPGAGPGGGRDGRGPDTLTVLTVAGGRLAEATLHLGLVGEDRVEVAAGLAEGDPVVVRGADGLEPGALVRIVRR